jgi:hypothetical protein
MSNALGNFHLHCVKYIIVPTDDVQMKYIFYGQETPWASCQFWHTKKYQNKGITPKNQLIAKAWQMYVRALEEAHRTWPDIIEEYNAKWICFCHGGIPRKDLHHKDNVV